MITLTDAATAKVRQLLDAEGDPARFLRVAVRPGGCSGFSYEMFFDSERTDDDVEADLGAVKIIVDADSSQLLDGASLDYKDALQGGGFAISNPNSSHSCGCGQSFS